MQLGFDYMLPSRVVLGVAADISSGGTKTTTISDPAGISANQTTVFDSETIRGRFGYAADNVLFYATGGFAWSNAQFVRTQLTGALNSATAGTDEAVNKGLMGWTAGVGIAYAFAQNWNVFAEYRYTNFGTSTVALPLSQLTTTTTTTVSALEFGVNYKFTSSGQLTSAPAATYPAGAPSPALVYKSPPGRYAYVLSGKRRAHGSGGGLPERLNGLFDPSVELVGRAAHARWSDRYHRHSENGRRIQTCAAHISAAGTELRLDGLLCRRLRRRHLVQNERFDS